MTFQFENMSEFFNMGGYAFFVWASFLGTFFCMFGILFQSIYVSKIIKQGVQKERARAERIMAARAARKIKQEAKINEVNNES
jgi:heme exporter protein D